MDSRDTSTVWANDRTRQVSLRLNTASMSAFMQTLVSTWREAGLPEQSLADALRKFITREVTDQVPDPENVEGELVDVDWLGLARHYADSLVLTAEAREA